MAGDRYRQPPRPHAPRLATDTKHRVPVYLAHDQLTEIQQLLLDLHSSHGAHMSFNSFARLSFSAALVLLAPLVASSATLEPLTIEEIQAYVLERIGALP